MSDDRVIDKITEINQFIRELEDAIPPSFEEYTQDFVRRAACERYFDKIVEAMVDLAFLIIKKKTLRIPEHDTDAFDILAEKNVISFILAKRLKEAKGMRNFLSHQYGRVDDSKVYHAITEQLFSDVNEFLEAAPGEDKK